MAVDRISPFLDVKCGQALPPVTRALLSRKT